MTVSGGDRWVYGFADEPGTIQAADLSPEAMERRIRLSVGKPLRELHIDRIGRFSYGAMLADRFREGRAFLAGNAAHQVTPRGGTGMNTAITMAATSAGSWPGGSTAGPATSCCDSCGPSGGSHSAQHGALVDPNGSIRSVTEELHVDSGPRIPHASVEPSVSTLDLLGEASPCSADRRRTGAQQRHRRPWPSTASTRSRPAPRAEHARRHAGAPDGVAAELLRSTGRRRQGAAPRPPGLTGGRDLGPELASGCLGLSPRDQKPGGHDRSDGRSPNTRWSAMEAVDGGLGGSPRAARRDKVPRAAMPTANTVCRNMSSRPPRARFARQAGR